jgi:4-alpha-glucanotransferase
MTTDAWGIDREYEDAFHRKRTPPAATIEVIQKAIGANPAQTPPQPRTIVIRRGERPAVGPADVLLEDGAVLSVNSTLPADLPLGYHELHGRDQDRVVRLIVSPGACPLPADRSWAWTVQLYATRSQASWGMGDLADLRELARWSKGLGAGLVMINPLHAPAPVLPQEPSPYFPASRRFRNPLYLRIEEVPGANEQGVDLDALAAAGRALNGGGRIDRDEVFRLKRAAFEQIFARFSGDDDFERYRKEIGEPLWTYGTFCVLAEHYGDDFHNWPVAYRHPAGSAVASFREQHAARVRFHAWLQWLIDRQLTAAAAELPIMQDLAVGFHPGGADAWMWQDLLADKMSVGAPPDLHNPWGQNWGIPPFVPQKLDEAGYDPIIQTIRAALAHAGGLRIDHAMGLFRLFWIPYGAQASEGTYVNYPARALLDIVALESHRAGAFIVAEDLGTVQEHMRDQFMKHQMLSYRVLWLEKDGPKSYPQRSMAAVTTHDLYTIAGLWTGSDFRNQQAIGLNPHPESVEEVYLRIAKMIGLSADSPLTEVVLAVHRLLADANSMVVAATLEDALLVEDRPNMPGTTDQWPNWRIALPAVIEDIKRRDLPAQIAAILNQRKSGASVSHF